MKNPKSLFSALLVVGLSAGMLAQSAFAFGGHFAQNHPRRAEVLGRDNGLRNEIKGDRGQLNGNYGKFMAQDRQIRHQEQRDARINGGYITPGQQAKLNREENHLANKVDRNDANFAQNHPRRAEVLGRDQNLSNKIKADRGQLNGNYGKLMAADRRIHNQEQRFARQNNGHITQQEQHRLNREENHLNHRINKASR